MNLECGLCEERCSPIGYLNGHVEENAGINKKPFKCDACEIMFERKFNLVSHKRLTHDEQVDVASKIECKICEKVFLSEAKLNVHMED